MPSRPKAVRAGPSLKRRLFFVEDHPITREGFTELLNREADFVVCGSAASGAQALAAAAALKPDLVIVDLSLAGSNSLELIKQLRSRLPDTPVLVLSIHEESFYAQRALRAGARGYVMMQAPTREVMGAIRAVLGGDLYLSAPMRARVLQEHLHNAPARRGPEEATLSDRELEVLELIGHGQTTRRIAARLHLSISTVETHRAHIKQKLDLADATELVQRAVHWVNR